jgi:hypothetical protein
MPYVEVTTRVVPASREALECFPLKDLRAYAQTFGIRPQPTKEQTIDALLHRGHRKDGCKATLCASLGD